VLLQIYRILAPLYYPLQGLLKTVHATISPLLSTLLIPFLNWLATLTVDQPGAVSLAVVLLSLYISLRILGFLKRLIVYWTFMAFYLGIAALACLAAYTVYLRGVEQTVEDVQGWAESVQGIWMREYRKWDQLHEQAAAAAKGGGPQRGHR
jgi:hypothetical protein